MNISRLIEGFWTSEDGATSIVWVVLTAGLIGLGFGVVTTLGEGSDRLADGVATCFESDAQNMAVSYQERMGAAQDLCGGTW